MVAGAVGRATAADLEPEPDGAGKCSDRALGFIGRPERPRAFGAGSSERGQLEGLIRFGAGSPSGHGGTPWSRIDIRSNKSWYFQSRKLCYPRKKDDDRALADYDEAIRLDPRASGAF